MIKEEISKFMALVPLMLPKLIRSNGPDETDITDDSGILFFSLEERLPISIVMDEIDDGMEGSITVVSLRVPKHQTPCLNST